MHADSLHSRPGPVARGHPVPGTQPLLLSVLEKGLQREPDMGALAPPGPSGGWWGAGEHRVLDTVGSPVGTHLHVKGRQYSIYFNKHLQCASDRSVVLVGGWPGFCPCGTPSHALSRPGSRVGHVLVTGCSLHALVFCPVALHPPSPPPLQESSQAEFYCISLLWMSLPPSQPLGRAHNFNPPCARGKGRDTRGYKTSYVHRVLRSTPPQACTRLGTVGAGVELRWMVWM